MNFFNARPTTQLARLVLPCIFALSSMPALAQLSASPFTSASRWDTERRLVGEIKPDPDGEGPLSFPAMRLTYDANGNIVRREDGELSSWQSEAIAPADWTGFIVLKSTESTFDLLDRKIEQVVRSGSNVYAVTQFSYTESGALECTAVRMNPTAYGNLPASACALGTEGSQGPDRITKNVYNTAGQLVQVRKAVSTSLEQAYTTYSYTLNGKQEYVIDANGNRAKLEYDGFDRQKKWIFPSATLPSGYNPSTQANALATAGSINGADYEEYGYDANGNRTSLRKRDGSMLTYQYDALGRMTLKTVPERSDLSTPYTRDVYYSYDARGLMTAARFDSANGEGISIIYDGFGRISSSTLTMDGVSRQLGSLYDPNGNRIRLTFPDNAYITYAYDGLDRPQSVIGNTADWTRSYAYNAGGTLASDTVGSGGTTTFGRDPIGRLNSLERDIAGATSLDNTTTFGYNPANQIAQEGRTNDAYAFTERANFNRTYTPNGLNQYAAVNSNAYCYDANGNLTADGNDVYLYDIENRLVEKRAQGGSNSNCAALSYDGTLKARLRYDPMGRLYETVGNETGTTRYLIDGDALVAEYDGSGALLRRYVHGADGKADDPIAWYEGGAMVNGALHHLYANHQGSIILTADSAGSSARIFRFDEYGVPQGDTGAPLTPANGARFLYTGQAWIPDLGMYYYKARVYSPMLGRFMQTDPIGYDDQVNLYAYLGNDPLNARDPSGTSQEDEDRIRKAKELENARRAAVREAWAQERELVRQGGSTRDWTPAQKKELITDGKVSGFEGHHRNTVNGNSLQSARDPNNIEFLTKAEHARIHIEAGGHRTPIRGLDTLSRRASSASWISDFTGMLSGRIRTDSFDNMFSDLAGIPSAEDRMRDVAMRCGRAIAASGGDCI